MHHDRHCHRHHRHHHRHHGHHGHHHDRDEGGGCEACRPRREERGCGCGCPCCGGGRDRGGFDEKRLVDTIVRLVTENVSREVENIVNEVANRLRAEMSGPRESKDEGSCPECGQ